METNKTKELIIRRDCFGNIYTQTELIRCKDCVHWIPGRITDTDDFIPPRCIRNGGGWSADEYCSNGEKKE